MVLQLPKMMWNKKIVFVNKLGDVRATNITHGVQILKYVFSRVYFFAQFTQEVRKE